MKILGTKNILMLFKCEALTFCVCSSDSQMASKRQIIQLSASLEIISVLPILYNLIFYQFCMEIRSNIIRNFDEFCK